jgi:peptidoglycan DL-endopeptidase CwlO
VKEEPSLLRHALAVGAFALLLVTGSFGIAAASQSRMPTDKQIATSDAAVESGVQSPDVAEWTAHLIVTPKEHGKNGEFRSFAGGVLARTSQLAQRLTRSALRFLGVPYVFGGTTASGFDCSGFVQHVFGMLGMSIPRTADEQYDAGHRIVGRMKPGDLVFFQTYTPGPSHVGIYLGHGKFVHASSHGVMISHLSDSYWAAHYIGAKRLVARQPQ